MIADEFLSKTLTSEINKLIEVEVDFKVFKYKSGEVSGVSGKVDFFGFTRYFSLYNIDVKNIDEILIGINNVRAKFLSVLNEPILNHSDMLHSDIISRWVYEAQYDTTKTMRSSEDISNEILKYGGTVREAFVKINDPYFNLYQDSVS